MKNFWILFQFLIVFFVSQRMFADSGHWPTSSLLHHSGTYSGTYSVNPNYRQALNQKNMARSDIWSVDDVEVYVLFQFDTGGKNVYLVYTTDGSNPTKTNGTSVSCSFDYYSNPNRFWRGVIPKQAANTLVKYVFYISDNTLANAWGRVAGESGSNSQYQTSWTEGDNYFQYTVKPNTTYRTVAFTGSENDWLSEEKLGSNNGTDFYLTWDDTYLYVGFFTSNLRTNSGSDRFNIAIDVNPGTSGGTTSNFSLYNFSTNNDNLNKPDYAIQFVNNNNNPSLKLYNGTTGSWNSGDEKISIYYNYVVYANSGGDIEFRVPWSDLGGKPSSSWSVIMWTNNNADDYIISTFPTTNPTSTTNGVVLNVIDVYKFPDSGENKIPNSYGNTSPLPVELIDFKLIYNSNNIKLIWTTTTETQNYGWEIERSQIDKSTNRPSAWQVIGFVKGSGNSNSPKEYSFVDNTAIYGEYAYRLKQIDIDGTTSYSNELRIFVGSKPQVYDLKAYPNPFNPSTTIRFELPEAGNVKLEVYDLLGRLVDVLIDEYLDEGVYQKEFNGGIISSGIYFIVCNINGKNLIKKVELIK